MTRVKTGKVRRQHHKKVLKMMKGRYGTRHRLFRRANEAMLKSLWYSYRDRRTRKRTLRRLWIARINAAARLNGTTYSRLIYALRVWLINRLQLFSDQDIYSYSTFPVKFSEHKIL